MLPCSDDMTATVPPGTTRSRRVSRARNGLNALVTITSVNMSVGSIRGYLRAYARLLTRDPAGKVLLALLARAQHDPDTAKSLHTRYLGPRRGQERDMLTRA